MPKKAAPTDELIYWLRQQIKKALLENDVRNIYNYRQLGHYEGQRSLAQEIEKKLKDLGL